ncbi:GM10546 [Drosophila sechellia]|uniref:GM10546 n=2 Tax=Drosophila sechellia TaxID=7238 RepID=B4I4H5_DROSE|nr:GM10546 [Drosophila sechellia]
MNSLPIWQSVDQNLSCKAEGINNICKVAEISKIENTKPKDKKLAQPKHLKFAFTEPGPKKVFHCTEQSVLQSEDCWSAEEVLEESDEKSNLELEDIYDEVFRLKRRVNQLNYQLGTNIPECPNIHPCQDDHIYLMNVEGVHPDILQLKFASHKLEHQLTQMQSVRRTSNLAKKLVRDDYCRSRKLGDQLQIEIQKLDSFKLKFEKHQGLCLQRFRFLEQDKYTGREFNKYIEKSNEMIRTQLKKQVLKSEYKPFRKEASRVTISLKKAAENLQDYQSSVINNKKCEIFQIAKNSCVSIRSDF